MASVPQRHVFLVDDNFSGNLPGAKALMRALEPTGKRWLTQTSLAGLEDPSFVAEMARSGCLGVLIGFESLLKENLEAMNKGVNRVEVYAAALKNLRREGIFVYGTFLFGYPHDTADTFAEAVRFAVREKMFIAAFNHLVPFPGTPLYDELEAEGRLSHERWWLSEGFRFGQVPFAPASLTAREVEEGCLFARREFYRPTSILRRASRTDSK